MIKRMSAELNSSDGAMASDIRSNELVKALKIFFIIIISGVPKGMVGSFHA